MAAILVLGASCEGTEPENGDNGSNGNNTETPETPTDPVEAVSGTYSGALDILLSLTDGEASPVQSDLTNEIVISAATAENTVDVQVKALSVTGTGVGTLDFGDRTFEGCTVTEAEDGSYEIAGTAEMSAEVPGFVSPVNCTVTVAGTVTGETLDLQLTVSVAELPDFKTPAQMVAGTYDGKWNISSVPTEDSQALTVVISESESGDGTVTMQTNVVIGTDMDIEITGCTVKEGTTLSEYTISGAGQGAMGSYNLDVTFTGTVKVDGSISIVIDVATNMVYGDIKVYVIGTKTTETETPAE